MSPKRILQIITKHYFRLLYFYFSLIPFIGPFILLGYQKMTIKFFANGNDDGLMIPTNLKLLFKDGIKYAGFKLLWLLIIVGFTFFSYSTFQLINYGFGITFAILFFLSTLFLSSISTVIYCSNESLKEAFSLKIFKHLLSNNLIYLLLGFLEDLTIKVFLLIPIILIITLENFLFNLTPALVFTYFVIITYLVLALYIFIMIPIFYFTSNAPLAFEYSKILDLESD